MALTNRIWAKLLHFLQFVWLVLMSSKFGIWGVRNVNEGTSYYSQVTTTTLATSQEKYCTSGTNRHESNKKNRKRREGTSNNLSSKGLNELPNLFEGEGSPYTNQDPTIRIRAKTCDMTNMLNLDHDFTLNLKKVTMVNRL